MKLSRFTLGVASLALAVVGSAASTYKLNLTNPTWVGDTQLKPGEYKVEVTNGQATFKGDKQTAQAPAVEEKSDKKFPYTSFEAKDSKLNEIHFGGTNVKVVLKGAAESSEAGSK
jgi:hypothetical protein